ncbi:MAG: DUF5132 domain-containing protein [Deltaproteobacteria bacterium]|nr:DUF5132 domain-containing protein [Deltaproteobacteria bacterium]
MALLDNGYRVGAGLAVGIGAILLAPVLVPVVAAAAKPIIKAGIKGGMLLYAKTREIIAETQEVIEDLAAEAKSELAQEQQVVVPEVTSD